ncbi:MAG: adenylate/guanylate cyclase domain-containing protein [Rhodospirillales bacterium]|nr:MAG: adenylate/guanylate cyclase domain-containing protein [Rhodospirillales bacterium]
MAAADALDLADRARRRAEWRQIAIIAAIGCVGGIVFGAAIAKPPATPVSSALQGVVNSLAVSVPIMWVELDGRHGGAMSRLRRLPFVLYLLAKSLVYLAIIAAGTQATRLAFNVIHPQPLGFDRAFVDILIFAGIFSIAANLVIEVGTLVGFRTLGRLITGRYMRPRVEDRIFVLVDMVDSTGAAERLGDLAFHRLLAAFFEDVATTALEAGAEVHKFVGDEAILTWPMEPPANAGRALLYPFLLRRRLARRAAVYRDRFGVAPAFRAAAHSGPVVAGEMGLGKREIAFLGDTLNTASRLLAACRETGADTLASRALVDRGPPPAGVVADAVPPLALRGKDRPLDVAALRLA